MFYKCKNINELLKRAKFYSYSPPSNKLEKIADFYLLSRFYTTSFSDDMLDFSVKDAIEKITEDLKQDLLNNVFNAIVGESSLFSSFNDVTPESIKSSVENKKIQGFFLRVKQETDRILSMNKEDNFDYYEYIRKFGKRFFEGIGIDRIESIKNMIGFLNSLPNERISKTYINICNAWLQLNEASNLKDKIIQIDHIIDLQHAHGSLLERMPEYGNIEDDILDFLDLKAQSSNAWELWERASNKLKPLMAAIIKEQTGQTYEMYKSSPEKFISEFANENKEKITELLNLMKYNADLYEQCYLITNDKRYIDQLNTKLSYFEKRIKGISSQEDVNKVEEELYSDNFSISEELSQLSI